MKAVSEIGKIVKDILQNMREAEEFVRGMSFMRSV